MPTFELDLKHSEGDDMKHYPGWSTPDRRAQLVKLFVDSGGFCVFGHKDCLIPSHHYEVYIEHLIEDWKEDDRYLDYLERKALHNRAFRETVVSDGLVLPGGDELGVGPIVSRLRGSCRGS
jgi:hypothetical protein